MSSSARIQAALEKSFERHRLVFWYDSASEWWPEFEEISLSGVEKVTVDNNEFGLKHRIARDQSTQKFLLYFRGQTQPEDAQNWLLDQLLANGGRPFSPDRASLALIDAGLAPEFKPLADAHVDFFRSSDRTTKLRDSLKPDDSEENVVVKMIGITCRCEANLEAVLLTLLGELARGKSDRFDELKKYNLSEVLWKMTSKDYGYSSLDPTLLDFALALFRTIAPLDGTGAMLDRAQAALLVNRWKDSQTHRESYILLSENAANLLNIGGALNEVADTKRLLLNDTYRAIDLRILSDLRDQLVAETMDPVEIRQRASARAGLFWCRHDEGLLATYRALIAAADFITALNKLDLTIESPTAGVKKYSETWWRLDQLYRHFLHQRGLSGQMAVLASVSDWIEGQYLNNFLSPLAVNWQERVDRMPNWEVADVSSQREFHRRHVQPHTSAGRKMLVVISDALRFEAARELAQRIEAEDRWTATVTPALGVLPSYTQLGMAALLPHTKLAIEDGTTTALADGLASAGTANRDKILREAHGGHAGAMSTEDFLALNTKTQGRELFRDHEVIYVYHNAIDAVGDKRDTEHETCRAVEKALGELVKILKKAAAINFTTMLVTADHGFLYQEKGLDEADFLELEDKIPTELLHRRFVLSAVAGDASNFRAFTHEQLGLDSPGVITFPKGVQRLRKQGSGSRYVHGGTSLQEVVIPIIEVRKERADDTRKVAVDIIRTSQQITSGQVAITMVQLEPVSEKLHATELRIGFYAKGGESISEVKTVGFSSTAEDIRQRERVERFLFSRAADRYNNQDVIFRMEEAIPGTNQFATKQEYVFRLKRAFESDFDDI